MILTALARIKKFSFNQPNLVPLDESDYYWRQLQCKNVVEASAVLTPDLTPASPRKRKRTSSSINRPKVEELLVSYRHDESDNVCKAHCYKLVKKLMCHEACVYDNQYNAPSHTIRWCEHCETWQHVECLKDTEEVLYEELAERQPYLGPTDSLDESLVRLLLWPIQRAGVAERPLSYEMFVVSLRRYLRNNALSVETWEKDLWRDMKGWLQRSDFTRHVQKFKKTRVPQLMVCQVCAELTYV